MKYPLLLATVFGLAACGQPQETPAAAESPAAGAADTAAMPMTPAAGDMAAMPMGPAAGARTAAGTGVITAVDVDGGTVTIDHGAIPAVGWPAMTMRFTASPAVMEAARTGDRVEFDVSVRDGVKEITAIRPG